MKNSIIFVFLASILLVGVSGLTISHQNKINRVDELEHQLAAETSTKKEGDLKN